MATRKPVEGMPGYVWIYPGDPDMHGFRARHSYNADTGASLSLRATQAVQRGEMREEQALAMAAHPRKQEIKRIGGRNYRISHFGTIYGAARYASTRPGQAQQSIVAYGTVARKYKENEPDENWRTISDYGNPSSYRGKAALEEAYNRFDMSITSPSKQPTYSIMERLSR